MGGITSRPKLNIYQKESIENKFKLDVCNEKLNNALLLLNQQQKQYVETKTKNDAVRKRQRYLREIQQLQNFNVKYGGKTKKNKNKKRRKTNRKPIF